MDFTVTTNLRTYGLTSFPSLRVARDAARALEVEGERVESVALNVATEAEARASFADAVEEEEYRDNYRFAYADEAEAMEAYEETKADGCCGFADYAYMVGGRLLFIGCNYGH